MNLPRIIDLPEIQGKQGTYSVIESPVLPFQIERVYWIYDSTSGVTGGNHAHLNSDRLLCCVKGRADVHLESVDGQHYDFILDKPGRALFFPRLHWLTYTLYNDAILMAMVNTRFSDDIRIADYANFKNGIF